MSLATYNELLETIVKLNQGVQADKMRLGMFANHRELLECSGCGLVEDVTMSGLLLTCRQLSKDKDTGLRFAETAPGAFQCPSCGQTVQESHADGEPSNNNIAVSPGS